MVRLWSCFSSLISFKIIPNCELKITIKRFYLYPECWAQKLGLRFFSLSIKKPSFMQICQRKLLNATNLKRYSNSTFWILPICKIWNAESRKTKEEILAIERAFIFTIRLFSHNLQPGKKLARCVSVDFGVHVDRGEMSPFGGNFWKMASHSS